MLCHLSNLCCGYPLLSSGCVEAYNTNRHRNINDIQYKIAKAHIAGMDISTIITACGTCRESIESYDFTQGVNKKLKRFDAVQYLLSNPGNLDFHGLPANEEVVYHASCHTEWTDIPKSKAPAIYKQALESILGSKITLSPGCCGESGLGAISSPAIYNKLRDRKKDQLEHDLHGQNKKNSGSCRLSFL